MDINKIVKIYLRLRDEKARLTREYDMAIAELNTKQAVLSSAILDECKALNVESIRTDSGTAFKTIKKKYWIADWEALYDFIAEYDAFDLLEKRIAQATARAWVEENPDIPIPSMQVDSKYDITIRRSSS